MSLAPEVLLEQALALSPADRAKPASGLLASLDDDQAAEEDVERLWSEETARRVGQLESGDARAVSRDEVLEGLEELRAERSP
ncbi:MAG TPA: addiction module protein [Nocardioides sp.]